MTPRERFMDALLDAKYILVRMLGDTTTVREHKNYIEDESAIEVNETFYMFWDAECDEWNIHIARSIPATRTEPEDCDYINVGGVHQKASRAIEELLKVILQVRIDNIVGDYYTHKEWEEHERIEREGM